MFALRNLIVTASRIVPTFAAAFAGGWAFAALSLPLPWVLGAMAGAMSLKAFRPPASRVPKPLKRGALVVLGIAFGLQFTLATVRSVVPYLLPYLAVTAATIAFSVGLGALFARWTNTDLKSSVFGFIPGGLAEMVATGEAVGAKPGTVVFLQTLRLLSVLSVVPFLVTLWFGGGVVPPPAAASGAVPLTGSPIAFAPIAFVWYAPTVFAAWLLRKAVPASYVLVPMLLTAAMHVAGVPLPAAPHAAAVAAQVIVGAGLGESVSFRELRPVGKQWWRALSLIAAMLAATMALGAALHWLTGMDWPAALLSVAPGGLIEMALTASSVGADAAVVTSLQMIRLYTIIGLVPFLLKLWFGKTRTADR